MLELTLTDTCRNRVRAAKMTRPIMAMKLISSRISSVELHMNNEEREHSRQCVLWYFSTYSHVKFKIAHRNLQNISMALFISSVVLWRIQTQRYNQVKHDVTRTCAVHKQWRCRRWTWCPVRFQLCEFSLRYAPLLSHKTAHSAGPTQINVNVTLGTETAEILIIKKKHFLRSNCSLSYPSSFEIGTGIKLNE